MIEARGVSFRYPSSAEPALRDVCLDVAPGSLVSVVGANGCGKSTLLRLLNANLTPTSGVVTVDGHVAIDSAAEAREVSRLVGFVHQEPGSQLVSSLVSDEVAFGPCNLGLDAQEVRARVSESLEAVGLAGMASRGVDELSGGERQRLALAGVLAMHPSYLVLDEATSQLDGMARRAFATHVDRLVEGGTGVVQVTHSLAEVLRSDEVVVMSGGRVSWRGDVTGFLSDEGARGDAGLLLYAGQDVVDLLVARGLDPRFADDPVRMLSFAREHGLLATVSAMLDSDVAERGQDTARKSGIDLETGLRLVDASVRYGDRLALDSVCLDVPQGFVTLVAGESGSGKTTAARALTGIAPPDSGRALLGRQDVRAGQVGYGFQQATDQLFCDTVMQDVAYGPICHGLSAGESQRRAAEALRGLGVDEALWERSPFSLSGGQCERVALAGITSSQPSAYVFDEPTVGLDGSGREMLHTLVERLAGQGASVVVVSHDVGEWLDRSDELVILRDGRVAWSGPSGKARDDASVFEGEGLVAPIAVRLREEMARGWGR